MCRGHLRNLTKHHPSQGAALAQVARCYKWTHLVSKVFLLAQSWWGGGRPRSTGHPLSLARVMVMMEGGMKVDGFFLPHRASALSRLLELSTQATPCDITGHPPLHPASDRKCFQESRSMGSLDPSFIHSPMYSFIHSFTHLSTH